MLGIFLDSETNGLDPAKNRLIEIAYKLIDLHSGEIKDEYHSVIFQPDEVFDNSDLKSLKINGFTREEISKGKDEKTVSFEILENFEKNNINNETAVFICQNPSFDRVFLSQIINVETQNILNWPYHWLDLASMYWALAIKQKVNDKNFFPWESGFSKDLIASQYNPLKTQWF